MSAVRRVYAIVSISYTNGEEMFDDEYEVSGVVHRDDDKFYADSVVFSAPGGRIDDSRAITWLLPSSAYLEASDAIEDQAWEDWLHGGELSEYEPEEDR